MALYIDHAHLVGDKIVRDQVPRDGSEHEGLPLIQAILKSDLIKIKSGGVTQDKPRLLC
jgi:hypothetical protein